MSATLRTEDLLEVLDSVRPDPDDVSVEACAREHVAGHLLLCLGSLESVRWSAWVQCLAQSVAYWEDRRDDGGDWDRQFSTHAVKALMEIWHATM